mmetsp:Transcript_16328/g.16050  ORF Transcript_16328/g.16050 Transcript_16328/m.16050 type:complete len:347 (+) Transcript_16328:191-1231(+)
MPPGSTPFGTPTKKELLGETEIDKELFHEFLGDIKDRFSSLTYNVKTNNCNHFTNECSNFLVGNGIPKDISGQAEDLFNTPLGKMVEPMVMQQQDALKQGSSNMFGNESGDIASALGAMNIESTPTLGVGQKLIEVTTMVDMQSILNQYPGVIVDCWSPRCPPCIKFKPIFKSMAEFYGSDKIKFVMVDTTIAREVAMNFMVTSVPSFFIYKNAQCVENFVGADKVKIEKWIKTLKEDLGDAGESTSATPAAPPKLKLKYDLGFAQFKPWSNQEILFEKITAMSKIAAKIKDIISSIEGEELSELKTLMEQFSMAGLNQTILNQLLIVACKCDENDIFAIFDFLRC